jgi:hypothetical protein
MATWHGALHYLRQTLPFRIVIPHLPRVIREAAVQLATRQVHRRTVDMSDAIDYLRPIQRLQTEALVCLLGREFPEWTTLYGTDAR